MSHKQCCACGKQLDNCRERRKLHSSSTKHVLPVLLQALSAHLENLSEDAITRLLPHDSVICRTPCFSSLESLLRLEDEARKVREKIDSRLSQLYTASSSASSSVDVPTAKRLRFDRQDTPSRPKPSGRQHLFGEKLNPATSPVATVVVNSKKPKYFHLTPSRNKLAKYVGRGNRRSIVKLLVDEPKYREIILIKLGLLIQRELKVLSSRKTSSILRDRSKKGLLSFSWGAMWNELTMHTPTLLSLLEATLSSKSVSLAKTQPIICMAVAILSKFMNPSMNLVQSYVSILLHAGHCSKQVFCRLQKLMICMSSDSTLKLIETLGSDHDKAVLEWRDHLHQRLEQEVPENMILFDPADWSCGNGIEESFSGLHSSDEEMQFSPLACTTPPLTHHTPEAPPFSPLSSTSSATLPRSPDRMSISSEISVEHDPDDMLVSNPGHHDTATRDGTCGGKDMEEEVLPQVSDGWFGFKIVGDNIDKNVRPRHQSVDTRTQSLHYFHAFAVLDRVNLSSYSEIRPDINLTEFDLECLLPSLEDLHKLKCNFEVHISRIITKYLDCLKPLSGIVTQHIRHVHSNEMSKKSVVVPLGVQLKNENVLEEMVEIMSHMQEYVPTLSKMLDLEVTGESSIRVKADHFHNILLGGDQLTVARARGAQHVRENSVDGVGRLEGLVPVCEDWHARVVLLSVIWKRLYNTSSSRDGGTLVQLRNLTRRRLPQKPKDDVNSTDDFMDLILKSHVLSATMTVLGIKDLDAIPSFLPDNLSCESSSKKKDILDSIVRKVVDKFVNIELFSGSNQKAQDIDEVLEYAKETLSLSLFHEEFQDAIREGDGERVLNAWKFLLPAFKASNKVNYSIEAFNMLAQYYILLPPRLSQQLIWSRYVNTHGQPGKNIPCDLHLEHLNRALKTAICHLGANIVPRAVERAGRCIGEMVSLCHHFDTSCGINPVSSSHSTANLEKDLKLVVRELISTSKVFEHTAERTHTSLKVKGSIFKTVNKKSLLLWMKDRLKVITP